ncbi:GGDEF domain-containing protein [Psychromonas marina]|uniref:diguanylate cyclase n=1 Tax=Psychromonas marina TaxID=88364 RepID=A0ABQ6E4M4_9GAMM|nr:diguanylate cyclase [Psychromonas marina]GLS92275.1 GGDEF domain-containing protein [Psychromonas marina]
MNDFLLDKIIAAQHAFLSCHDTKSLITTTSHFLSQSLQPDDILFCIEGDQFRCLAQHKAGKPIHHLDCSKTNLDSASNNDISSEKLWSLAKQEKQLSPYLPITYLQINDADNKKQDWYCLKLQMKNKKGIFIFLRSPSNEIIEFWKNDPLPSALMMQFFHLFQKLRLNSYCNVQLTNRDKKEALYLQKIQQQQEFSSKILKLQEITQELISSSSLDNLYKNSVEALRTILGFDRTGLILVDQNQQLIYFTYGTDIEGKTIDESTLIYDIEALPEQVQHAVLHTEKRIEVINNTALYDVDKVVGIGWNAIVILRDGDNLIGWISIDNLLNHRPLLSYEKELLTLYSSMLSTAIIQKREESNIKLLHSSALQLSHQVTELDICKTAVEITRKKLRIDRAAIFLSYDNGKTIFGTFGTDASGQLTDESKFHEPLSKHSLLTLAKSMPHQLTFEASAPLYENGKVVGHGWNAALLLHTQEQVIGFLVIDNLINKRSLTSQTEDLLTLFVSNLAEIITRKRAEESVYRFNNELENLVEKRTSELARVNDKLEESNRKLEQLSLVDSLTGIANRRHFDKNYKKEWAKACRNNQNLSAVMLDIDYFKAYNDHYGHQLGDQCLKDVANIVQQHFRRADELVARYGGEEFIILLTHSTPEQVKKRVQGAIDELYTININHRESPLQRVTLSAGIATLNIHKRMLPATLIKWADEALYQAKSEGRNKVVHKGYEHINSL